MADRVTNGTPRELGMVRSYDDLVQVLRDRADELNVSRLTIDDAAGLSLGHASRLLSPRPRQKILGQVSLGLVLGALGVKLMAVEDREALARIAPKLVKREVFVPIQAVKVGRGKRRLVSKKFLRRIARMGGVARMEKLTAKQRSQHGRAAVRARWARRKAA